MSVMHARVCMFEPHRRTAVRRKRLARPEREWPLSSCYPPGRIGDLSSTSIKSEPGGRRRFRRMTVRTKRVPTLNESAMGSTPYGSAAPLHAIGPVLPPHIEIDGDGGSREGVRGQ
jgi:hypothetical protein